MFETKDNQNQLRVALGLARESGQVLGVGSLPYEETPEPRPKPGNRKPRRDKIGVEQDAG